VDGYLKYRAAAVGRRSLKDVTTKIRSFLRWLYMTERTSRDLSSTVIAPMLYAFESIPSALRSGDVEKILAATRQDCTQKGIRDYAILMLVSKYGIRSGEIAALRLDDVDWRQEVMLIRHSKIGAISHLPLLPEVGEAVLKYLQHSRPKTSFREIFIRACAPYRPFRCGSSLYRLVRHRLEAANVITTGKRGPHAFRHARAVSMLRATVSVKDIGDLLGHRAADSTSVYLKLATEDLRAVALEIPTGVKA
jgi:integrase